MWKRRYKCFRKNLRRLYCARFSTRLLLRPYAHRSTLLQFFVIGVSPQGGRGEQSLLRIWIFPLITFPEQRLELFGEPVNVALPPLTALPPL